MEEVPAASFYSSLNSPSVKWLTFQSKIQISVIVAASPIIFLSFLWKPTRDPTRFPRVGLGLQMFFSSYSHVNQSNDPNIARIAVQNQITRELVLKPYAFFFGKGGWMVSNTVWFWNVFFPSVLLIMCINMEVKIWHSLLFFQVKQIFSLAALETITSRTWGSNNKRVDAFQLTED